MSLPFQATAGAGHRSYLRDLDPQSSIVIPIYGTLKKDIPETASSAYWMHHRIDPDLSGDFKAAGLKFEAE